MGSDHYRSPSQRSYRSISSRKERRRHMKHGNDSDSDSESGGSSNSGSFSGSGDNWEDDYNTSDNDSYYSKKNRDEEMGFDDETSMPEGSDGSTMGSSSSRSMSIRGKSTKSVKSNKSSKSKNSKRSNLKKIDSDIESDSESDSNSDSDSDNDSDDSSSSSDGSDSDSDDSDSEYDQRKENEIVRTKLKAIGLTALCFVLVTSAIALGIVLGTRKSKNDGPSSDSASTPATPPPVESTAAPTVAPSIFVEPTPAPTDSPTAQPTTLILTGDIDDVFPEDDEIVLDDNDIPNESTEQSNGDTYIMTLPDGTPFTPADNPGSSETLLVQGRNSLQDNEDFENSIRDVTSYALVNFNMAEQIWFEKDGVLGGYDVNAFVCLEHVPNSDPEDQWGNPQYEENGDVIRKIFSICRLDNSVELKDGEGVVEDGKVGTGEDVESISSDVASYSMPEDCVGGVFENFYVAANDTLVCIDVSSFVKNSPPFAIQVEEETEPVENRMLRRRFLQNDNLTESEAPRSSTSNNGDKLSESEVPIDASAAEESSSSTVLGNEFGSLNPKTPDNEQVTDSFNPEPRSPNGVPEFSEDMIEPRVEDDNSSTVLGNEFGSLNPKTPDNEQITDSFNPNPSSPNGVPEFSEDMIDPRVEDGNFYDDLFWNETSNFNEDMIEPRVEDGNFSTVFDDDLFWNETSDYNETMEEASSSYEVPDFSEDMIEARETQEDEDFEFSDTPEPVTESPTSSPTGDADKKIREIITDSSNFKNMLFMIANVEDNQDASAQFYSLNSVTGPSLVFDLKQNGTGVAPVDAPVDAPVAKFEATYSPCGVCGNFKSFVSLDETKSFDMSLDISPGPIASLAPPNAETATALCTEWESVCNDGYCAPQVCTSLLKASGFCGCPSPVAQPCGICGEDEMLEFPQAEVDLSAEQSPNGEATTMTCSFLEGYCEAGFCSRDVCSSLQNDSPCVCKSTLPSASPSASPPTLAPTENPTISQSPTFKAEFERCSICGGDPIDFSLKEDVVVELNDDITPSPVLNGKATCTELESLCEAGYCSDLMCTSYQESFAAECGCDDNIFAR